MIGDRNGRRSLLVGPLHDDVTSSAADFDKPVPTENDTNIAAGKDAQFTQR
jgi:hypothetical protein